MIDRTAEIVELFSITQNPAAASRRDELYRQLMHARDAQCRSIVDVKITKRS
jgi:hypothetical protein